MPALHVMAKTATKAIFFYVKTRGKRLNRHARNERMKVCESCNDLNANSLRCKVCGCFVRLKSWLPMEKCPNGKWSVVS